MLRQAITQFYDSFAILLKYFLPFLIDYMKTSFQNEFTYRHFVEEGKEQEFDELFDAAVDDVKKNLLGKRFPMYIGGSEVTAGEELEEHSPIDNSLIGSFQKGTRQHAQQAIDAAYAAFESWSSLNYKERIRWPRYSGARNSALRRF